MSRFIYLSLATLFVFGAVFSPRMARGESTFVQGIKGIFHYSEDGADRPKPKTYPEKFEKDLKKQIKYPEREK